MLVALSQNVYADSISGDIDLKNSKLDTMNVSGSASFQNMHFKSLDVSGSLNFENLTITEALHVSGAAKGKILKCKSLDVSGTFNGEDITINGKTVISGELNTKNSSFQDIEIKSSKSTLKNSTAHNIIVQPTTDKPQKLILKGSTIISGDVVFQSGDGEVHIGCLLYTSPSPRD